jgi:2-phosphosulfolactate phosphatase
MANLKRLEVTFAPAEFDALRARNLEQTTCVVFDVLRATSTMVTALSNGAKGVIPVETIAEAVRLREQEPGLLLAGERQGLRISAAISGGVEFDLGNSPREFTREKVGGRQIAMTTTNGTRALRACSHATVILAASFLNLRATAQAVLQLHKPELIIICAGTHEEASYEDALGAGALCECLAAGDNWQMSDGARMAQMLFSQRKNEIRQAFASSRNGHRLDQIPELRDDLDFCAQLDLFSHSVRMDDKGCLHLVIA